MTPAELYARAPEKVDRDLWSLVGCYYNHIPEATTWDDIPPEAKSYNPRLELRYYKQHCFDGRRTWVLASVWFDSAPVMIIQNAGREGDDHHRRFITDPERYTQLIGYLHSLAEKKPVDLSDVVPLDQDIKGLTEFYGNQLDGHFEYH